MAGLQGAWEVKPPRPVLMPDCIEGAGTAVMVGHVDTEDAIGEGRPRPKRWGDGRERRDWDCRKRPGIPQPTVSESKKRTIRVTSLMESLSEECAGRCQSGD